jgi:hypothetical protein
MKVEEFSGPRGAIWQNRLINRLKFPETVDRPMWELRERRARPPMGVSMTARPSLPRWPRAFTSI